MIAMAVRTETAVAEWFRKTSRLLIEALQIAATQQPVFLLFSLVMVVAIALVAAFGVQV